MRRLARTIIPMAASAALAGAPAAAAPQDETPARVPAAPVWHTDLEVASAIAKKEGKHLLVDFNGSGWCGFCKRLHQEVFESKEFGASIGDDYVLVTLDFGPDMEPRATGDLGARHAALKERFDVRGFPTVLLMTPEGVAYQRMGYERIGGAAYTRKIELERDRAVFLETRVPRIRGAVTRAKSAEEARAAADAATELLGQAEDHPLARPLIPLVKASLTREKIEPEREAAAVMALSLANAVDGPLIDRAFRLDPANRAGLPEAALAGAFKAVTAPDEVEALIDRAEGLLKLGPPFDAQRAARLFGDAAYWSDAWLDDGARAARLARYALALKPEDKGLRSMLEGLSAGR